MIGSSGPIPAGTFEGGGTVVLDLTAQARPGDQVAVTVEPARRVGPADHEADRRRGRLGGQRTR